jgi:hypothetical protein
MATANKSPMVSKPVVITFGLSVVIYVVYLVAGPQAPVSTPGHRVATAKTAAVDETGITPEDLKAHFPRVTAGARDPFEPRTTDTSDASSVGTRGQWALTGIDSINGVTSALVENGTTGDSAFLRPGDHWHGLTVVSIAPEAVVFENELGQQTKLAFPIMADTAADGRGGNPPVNPAPVGGSGSGFQVVPLPGLAAPGTAAPPASGGQGNVNP